MTITLVHSHGANVRTTRAALLTPARRERARVETNAWIKRLRLVRYDGATMRERFTYKGDSLWWFTELYLHKMRQLDTAIETVLALDAAREMGPARLIVESGDAAARHAALAYGHAHAIPVDVRPRDADARRGREQDSRLVGWTGRLSRLVRPALGPPPRRPTVAAFVHTAFWRADDPQDETYIGPVLDALVQQASRDDVRFVGLGPRRNFRARRWWDPVTASPPSAIVPIERFAATGALRGSWDVWRTRARLARELTTGDDIRGAGHVLGCDLWPILKHELESVALLQWPWSARTMDEAAAALDALEPRAIVTYAEAGAWGRALVLESRRRGIPSVGVQHGFIYRHWLNYRHEPDEIAPIGADDRGFPAPDRTLVYDLYAAGHLRQAGRFPPERVAVTGSPRLEALTHRLAALAPRRDELRHRLGIGDGQKLAVLAAKYVEIAPELPALVEAVSQCPDAFLAIKPHPAETPSLYAPLTAGRSRMVVAPASADLAELLAAADAIVTMNSTVAIDGLVLGLPSVVVGLPNNLSPFVEAGVMLGGSGPGEIRQALDAVLYDRQVQGRLREQADAFVARHELAPRPGAAARAAATILELARG